MTRLMLSVLGAFLLFLSSPANAIDRYFAVAPGIPMAEGLFEEATERLVFDSPSGRIVQTSAAGVISWGKIERFYLDALPQLGWQLENRATGKLSFLRDEERLELVRQGVVGGHIRINLSIKPSN